jgi:hypothetical protein
VDNLCAFQVIDNTIASGAIFDEVYWDGRDRLAAMKRTVTVTFELTRSQTNKIKLLGSMLWPSQNLPYPEICRRVLLDGADHLLATSAHERSAGSMLHAQPEEIEKRKLKPVLILLPDINFRARPSR